jgi:hypothetical protein
MRIRYQKRNIVIAAISLLVVSVLISGDLLDITNAPGQSSLALATNTGQSMSHGTRDDGDHKRVDTGPCPRFTVGAAGGATNCVTDNLTGLVWARNANMCGKTSWSNAIDYCNNLDYGGHSDWRLPNRSELLSLIDIGCYRPALSAGHPFIGVQSEKYWTSSTSKYVRDWAWFVYLRWGESCEDDKKGLHYLWPVRGRQQ